MQYTKYCSSPSQRAILIKRMRREPIKIGHVDRNDQLIKFTINDPDPNAKYFATLEVSVELLDTYGKYQYFPRSRGAWEAIGSTVTKNVYLVMEDISSDDVYILYDLMGAITLLGKLDSGCSLHVLALSRFNKTKFNYKIKPIEDREFWFAFGTQSTPDEWCTSS